MRHKLLIGTGVALGCVAAFAAKDPVVMTINGVDVPRSEFEYLYHKNTQQQLEAQPLDEYVKMFELYKMKVADALEAGIDTTAKFRREMMQYRNELGAPYLVDSVYLETLARQQYDRMGTEVEAKHIMMPKAQSRDANLRTRAVMDSIHNLITSGTKTFEELAAEFSTDRLSKTNGGNMGWITAGPLPYSFENVVYDTPEGQISEVFESPVAYHIVKGGHRRANSGEVLASHILLMADRNMSEPGKLKVKAKADSIYNILKADPSRFADIARQYSQDRGSAKNGGELPWFGVGQMVPAFSDAAFALKDGEISEPVLSPYGYHIIYRRDHRARPEFSQVRDKLISRITNPQDERRELLMLNQNQALGKKFKLKVNKPLCDKMLAYVAANGFDENFAKTFSEGAVGEQELFSIGKTKHPVKDYMKLAKTLSRSNDVDLTKTLSRSIDNLINRALREAQLDALPAEQPEYRNLLNEYRDGSLLYEISVRNVWEKASQDEKGLNDYFQAHRGDFTWTEPRVKGILIKTVNDSVAGKIRERLNTLGGDTIATTLRKEFGKDIQADRVLVKKGDNAFIDYLVFDPKNSQPPLSSNFPVYFMYNPVILEQPSCPEDVKGLLTQAYQDQLEQEWVKELRRKYPVKVNEKELRKIK